MGNFYGLSHLIANTTLPQADPDGFMPFQHNYWFWKFVGFAGMAAFFTRFFVQWLYSEKKGESKIPTIFWWQSLLGALLMLAYSLRQQDSVYIFGYLLTVIPYTRNLILVYRKKNQEGAPALFPDARVGDPVGRHTADVRSVVAGPSLAKK